MNCNSNTAPLIDTSTTNLSCNNGCSPKDINVVCRHIIIPYGQEIIAVENDENSSKRIFILPIETESGITLSDKSFFITTENSDGTQWRTAIPTENIEILDNYIKLRWDITQNETAVAGKLKLQIEALGEDFKWQTYIANFNVEKSLEQCENQLIPPLNLQEKVSTPSESEQMVKPDIGYNGLSQVIVFGDTNLIPENIKKGVTIFGVVGEYE